MRTLTPTQYEMLSGMDDPTSEWEDTYDGYDAQLEELRAASLVATEYRENDASFWYDYHITHRGRVALRAHRAFLASVGA